MPLIAINFHVILSVSAILPAHGWCWVLGTCRHCHQPFCDISGPPDLYLSPHSSSLSPHYLPHLLLQAETLIMWPGHVTGPCDILINLIGYQDHVFWPCAASGRNSYHVTWSCDWIMWHSHEFDWILGSCSWTKWLLPKILQKITGTFGQNTFQEFHTLSL